MNKIIKLQQEIVSLTFEINRIQAWFASTDYYNNKVTRGEWLETEPKFIAYKKEAKEKAEKLEEIKEKIIKLKKELQKEKMA